MPAMDAAAWGVLAGGVVLIAAVLWYFFGEREAVRGAPTEGGVQEVKSSNRPSPGRRGPTVG